jgi:hypothetical protein
MPVIGHRSSVFVRAVELSDQAIGGHQLNDLVDDEPQPTAVVPVLLEFRGRIRQQPGPVGLQEQPSPDWRGVAVRRRVGR